MGGHARTAIRSPSERHPGYTDQGAIVVRSKRHQCPITAPFVHQSTPHVPPKHHHSTITDSREPRSAPEPPHERCISQAGSACEVLIPPFP